VANVALGAGALALVGAIDAWTAVFGGFGLVVAPIAVASAARCGVLALRERRERARAATGLATTGLAAMMLVYLGVVLATGGFS
jgi:hypothetical protein